MPTPPPRHLARPRQPWRLLVFAFGLTAAILAAVVASATLTPRQSPPPGGALPTLPAEPAPTPTATTTAPGYGPVPAGVAATVGGTTMTTGARSTFGVTTPPPSVTASTATVEPSITAPATTVQPTTTVEPSTTAPTTTVQPSTTAPTTTAQPSTTAPSTTVGVLLPVLSLLYLLRGLLPQPGGRHAKRRAKHLRRRREREVDEVEPVPAGGPRKT
jgi:hypothetical protein